MYLVCLLMKKASYCDDIFIIVGSIPHSATHLGVDPILAGRKKYLIFFCYIWDAFKSSSIVGWTIVSRVKLWTKTQHCNTGKLVCTHHICCLFWTGWRDLVGYYSDVKLVARFPIFTWFYFSNTLLCGKVCPKIVVAMTLELTKRGTSLLNPLL